MAKTRKTDTVITITLSVTKAAVMNFLLMHMSRSSETMSDYLYSIKALTSKKRICTLYQFLPQPETLNFIKALCAKESSAIGLISHGEVYLTPEYKTALNAIMANFVNNPEIRKIATEWKKCERAVKEENETREVNYAIARLKRAGFIVTKKEENDTKNQVHERSTS